jgi:hypothetical protein
MRKEVVKRAARKAISAVKTVISLNSEVSISKWHLTLHKPNRSWPRISRGGGGARSAVFTGERERWRFGRLIKRCRALAVG